MINILILALVLFLLSPPFFQRQANGNEALLENVTVDQVKELTVNALGGEEQALRKLCVIVKDPEPYGSSIEVAVSLFVDEELRATCAELPAEL